MKKALICLLFVFSSCSDLERSEGEKIKKCNEKREKIYRQKNESYFSQVDFPDFKREKYPWQNLEKSELPKITKEFFSCKGSEIHPPIRKEGKNEAIVDCLGFEKHTLPMIDGKEVVNLALVAILNYIQEKCLKQVVITSGHRCLAHELYCSGGVLDAASKHLTAEEVDFYVEGLEENPLEVVSYIMDYYQKFNQTDLNRFIKCKKNNRNLTHPGWYNKEIIIRINEKDEGRDFDNRHPYPYISIELRS